MTDNELLLAISRVMDFKLEPIKTDITEIKKDVCELKVEMKEVKEDIREIKTENYLPSAKRYESATNQLNEMKEDIHILKGVIMEHSKKLQKIYIFPIKFLKTYVDIMNDRNPHLTPGNQRQESVN